MRVTYGYVKSAASQCARADGVPARLISIRLLLLLRALPGRVSTSPEYVV